MPYITIPLKDYIKKVVSTIPPEIVTELFSMGYDVVLNEDCRDGINTTLQIVNNKIVPKIRFYEKHVVFITQDELRPIGARIRTALELGK